MEYLVNDIVKDVQVILDYNSQSGDELSLTEDLGTLDIAEVVRSQVLAGVKQVMMVAPRDYVRWENVYDDSDYVEKKRNEPAPGATKPTYYEVTVKNALRIGSVKASNWNYPVQEFYAVGSKEHKRQFGEFTELRATSERPIVVADYSVDGIVKLYLFGGNDNNSVNMVNVLKEPESVSGTDINEGYEVINMMSVAYKPVLYAIASLVCEILKDTNKSNQMVAVMKNLLTNADAVQVQQAG